MNITFMIGNGFDIKMGLKSKYSDIYNVYTDDNNRTNNEIFEKFKDILRKDSPVYEKWSDFEKAMGEHAKNFENQSDYIECIRDFRKTMQKCLYKEQDDFKEKFYQMDKKELYNVFYNSLYNFYDLETPNTIYAIENLRKKNGDFRFSFLNFNYTNALDILIKLFRDENNYLGRVNLIISNIHVHGTLYDNIVLGVDNEEQLNANFEITDSLRRTFVKPFFNENTDIQKVNSTKNTIQYSDIICVYGMSLGNTDLTWKNLIVKWLFDDDSHLLFYFKYPPSDIPKQNRDEILDKEDELKEELIKTLKTDEHKDLTSVINQIHIPVIKDLFDISSVSLISNDEEETDKN